MIIKFKRATLNHIPCYLSECGEYKVIKYGKHIYAYHKIDSMVNNKKCRLFGNSMEYKNNKSMEYTTYKQAFSAVNRIVNK